MRCEHGHTNCGYSEERRKLVETLIDIAAFWGWSQAVNGVAVRPHPVVIWDDEGRPSIAGLRT